MFNRYRKCCCQNNYNPQVIEDLCNDVGTTAQFASIPKIIAVADVIAIVVVTVVVAVRWHQIK